ncbi:DUF7927 domain-containing protein [Streptomyces boluensis]|uniref:DUF11 domain-containing protein n=1 Tax=Streptomyces boluensis TaxID=1775135 RepID=A0A964UXF7_9ACTN|nr:DUF11 domain-containing protein [Streptomyces boluensis]NBE54617.1 DUF11 domain-containing protein [Streptomyces boluensis]
MPQSWRTGRRGPARLVGALIAVATAATSLIGAAPAAAVVVEPFAKRYDEALYGDFITLGNSVLDCPSTPADEAAACRTAQSGGSTANNNQFDMQYVNTAGLSSPVLNSSTGKVRIPPGAEVAYARLFWGGNDGTYKLGRNQIQRCDTAGVATSPAGDPLSTQPVIKVNGGAETPVTVQNAVRTPSEVGGPHYYTAEADVTSSFQAMASGSDVPVSVGNVWAPTGKGCVGGWSLTVVYKYDAPNAQYAPDRRNVYVYGGHVVQQSKDPDTTITVDGFYRTGDGKLRASTTAYEGDANVSGDQFLVNGTNIANSAGSTNNFFNSHAEGCLDPCDANNFSIDAETVDIPAGTIKQGATSADLTFRTKGDTYVPSALAFSVPVPDLEVTKTASPKTVHPGDTLTYTVKAKNISRLPYPNAKFTDDLTDTLDDATYNGDAKTDTGKVDYDAPRIGFQGDIAPDETATITYSVTVNDPVSGDGKLRNNVDVSSPRSNCEAGSTDPACGVTPEVRQRPEATPHIEISNIPADPTVAPCASTTNTITLKNSSGDRREGVEIEWPVRAGGTPQTSSGTVTKEGDVYVWKGDVPAESKVRIVQRVRASCTPGKVTVLTVTARAAKTTCPPVDERAGGSDPCTSVITSSRVQARQALAPESGAQAAPQRAELATTGTGTPTLLYTGISVVLCGLGALAMAMTRGRRRD